MVINMKWEENVRKVVPYVAGEQPNRPNMIKLNTNECPYPPAPGVRKAAENMERKMSLNWSFGLNWQKS